MYGLDIFKDEDREEGLRIVKNMMANDAGKDSEPEPESYYALSAWV